MKFLAGEPAAVVGSSLVVADVHLGFEFELQKKGVRIRPDVKKLAEKFNRLLKETRACKLIVLGDFKHDVAGFELSERRLVNDFCEMLDAKEITVVKGNHDSLLEKVGKLRVEPAEGIVFKAEGKSFGLHHGHAWPSKPLFESDFLLMGNNHPAIEFKDSLGFRWVEKCWVRGELKTTALNKKTAVEKGVVDGQKAIIFPAFSPLYPGTPFNRVESFELLGPLFKNQLFDLQNAVATTLAGVKLGKIKALRKA